MMPVQLASLLMRGDGGMEELDGSIAAGSAVANHFKLLLATKNSRNPK
jgi:hypothetical protein